MVMLHRVADAAFRLKAEATGTKGADSVVSAFRRKISIRGLALGAALAAQALSCAYYGIFAALMVAFGTLILASTRRLWRSAAYWAAIAIGAATSIVVVLPFFLMYLRVQAETGFSRSIGDAARWAVDRIDGV